MTTERRYGEREVAEILDLAIRAEAHRPAEGERGGTTLLELQEAASEAGIDPRRVADAAAVLEARAAALPAKRVLGMPVSVSRVAELDRPLNDHEWEVLVGQLRDTFAAAGQVGRQGAAREWRNGRLRILLEPTETGQRLRMTTLSTRFQTAAAMGLVELALGSVLLATSVPVVAAQGISLESLSALVPSLLVTLTGGGVLGWVRSALPRWVTERGTQMEQIAVRARALADRGRNPASPPRAVAPGPPDRLLG